ncbi:hypothetical protein [Actinomadura flavalba]|uniref:hypothetical protein n=1 Tax=Actinomadura flavalba TaxID=1120938 RepID=UPI000370515E|nr:hypothetical protein [Actinomadura flavalba]
MTNKEARNLEPGDEIVPWASPDIGEVTVRVAPTEIRHHSDGAEVQVLTQEIVAWPLMEADDDVPLGTW